MSSCEYCRGDEVWRIDDGDQFVHVGRCAREYAYERVYDSAGVINENLTIN
ncbi:hypothetical protein [Paenibacillus pinihumi]|uniref:hypothetical protein n=1 Tax=Paenibacillus pinihumi TaxID=669462 RepID=UPI0012B573DE|nr:hypothetical protein [Paenibacillus pinihumi]